MQCLINHTHEARSLIIWNLWFQAIYLLVVLENQVTFAPVTLILHLELIVTEFSPSRMTKLQATVAHNY